MELPILRVFAFTCEHEAISTGCKLYWCESCRLRGEDRVSASPFSGKILDLRNEVAGVAGEIMNGTVEVVPDL